jgi:hypothetical protein
VCAGTLLKAYITQPNGRWPGGITEAHKHDRLINTSVRITKATSNGLSSELAAYYIQVQGDPILYYVATSQPNTFASSRPGPCKADPAASSRSSSVAASPPQPSPRFSSPAPVSKDGQSSALSKPTPPINALIEAMRTKITPDDTPQKIAVVFWKTALKECKRPEEATPSLFYSSSATKTDTGAKPPNAVIATELVTDWQIEEYQGPFAYSDPLVALATEAEKRNTGLEWRATAVFKATVLRNISLHLRAWEDTNELLLPYSYKSTWSSWFDTGALGGTMTVTFRKDRSGITFDHMNWKPISCETAIASVPFADERKVTLCVLLEMVARCTGAARFGRSGQGLAARPLDNNDEVLLCKVSFRAACPASSVY